MKRIFLFFILVIVVINGCNSKKSLKEQGNDLIEKIEDYKKKNGCLPERLGDIGVEEKMEGPFYYWKVDSVNYMIWYCTTVGESMTYYSDTKEWDYRLRGMGDN
jgi:hypothetical protein